MSNIGDAFQSANLPAAIAAATAGVKASPRDAGARWLLTEMLLFAGDVERADRTLDSVIEEQPSPAVLEFRRLLRARTLDAARLVGKSMVTAGTLVDKARTGARDVNKYYGTSGPNYLRHPPAEPARHR